MASVEGTLRGFTEALDGADPREAGLRDADLHLAMYAVSSSELLSVLRGYWTRLQVKLSERVYSTKLPRRFLKEHLAVLTHSRTVTPNVRRRR